MTVTWNTGKRCNYVCSYCWKDLHDSVSAHRSFNEFAQAWINLKPAIQASGRPAQLIFTGGEPTTNPDFSRFVEYLNQTQRQWISWIALTTNGSETLDYYEKLLANLDGIAFSTHFEWWDESKFMTMLLDLWRRSGRNRTGKGVHVHLMYEDWDMGSVRKIREILEREGIPQTPYQIINHYGSKGIFNRHNTSFDHRAYLDARGENTDNLSYPVPELGKSDVTAQKGLTALLHEEEQIPPDHPDVFVELSDGTTRKASSVQMRDYGLTNFTGWTCHVERSYYIHHDGAIWAGNCFWQRLGNVYEEFTSLPGPVRCDGRLCVCPTDIVLEKYNPKPEQILPVPAEFRAGTHEQS